MLHYDAEQIISGFLMVIISTNKVVIVKTRYAVLQHSKYRKMECEEIKEDKSHQDYGGKMLINNSW